MVTGFPFHVSLQLFNVTTLFNTDFLNSNKKKKTSGVEIRLLKV